MTGAVSFVVKIFTEASASVASMVVTALAIPKHNLARQPHYCLENQGGGGGGGGLPSPPFSNPPFEILP